MASPSLRRCGRCDRTRLPSSSSTYDHDADIVRAVEAGAAGYLLKDAAPRDIVTAILRAAAGETVLSATLTQRVVDTMPHPPLPA